MVAQNGCQKWLPKMVAQNGCPKWNQFRFSQYHEDLKRSLIQQAVISSTNHHENLKRSLIQQAVISITNHFSRLSFKYSLVCNSILNNKKYKNTIPKDIKLLN